MTISNKSSTQPQAGNLHRYEFVGSELEKILRDWLIVASVFTGHSVALVLQEEKNIWYRDSSGITAEHFAALERVLIQGFTPESNEDLLRKQGFQIIEALSLLDISHRVIGTLCVLSPAPLRLSLDHLQGLKLVAGHVETILMKDQQKVEMRTMPRAPSAASFVPGLVHELRNFIFGISANLDAFNARFADQTEVSKYGDIIRKSLDRLNAFIGELKEYGDPQRFGWSERPLEPLLREALEHHKPLMAGNRADLQLQIEGTLPILNMDEESLRVAFVHLIGMVLQQEEAGGRVVLHVATRLQEKSVMICGYLDGSSLKLKDMDLTRLFEPFYYRASGLGRLALPGARRVFESHGGSLTAGPGPEGGLRISFMLPAVLTYPLRLAGQH